MGSTSLFCIFILFLDHVLGQRDSEREREIDIIDGDNLCVTPRFPKYRIRVRDDRQQILMKRKISSVNTLRYSK